MFRFCLQQRGPAPLAKLECGFDDAGKSTDSNSSLVGKSNPCSDARYRLKIKMETKR